MDPRNPDDLALLIVQQFLAENSYDSALRETESLHGLKYVADKLPRASMLLQMVFHHMEKEAAEGMDTTDVELQQEEETLMQGGSSDYPCRELACISDLHAFNITAVCHCPGSDTLITGSGDGSVQAFTFSGEQLWLAKRGGGGGAICLALHPQHRKGDLRLLVGMMDGTVWVVNTADGSTVASEKLHSKYVVSAKWAAAGDAIVSASWDGKVIVSELSIHVEAAGLTVVTCLLFPTPVQDILVLPGGDRLVVALRDTNYLRCRKLPEIQVEAERINMNALKDDHVSFSARQLSLSPDGRFLLVSTETPRILLFRIQGWRLLSSQIMGLPMDTFHTSVAHWHVSNFYLMAAAAAGQIYVFHTGTGKVVSKFKAHTQNVRWLDYDAERNLLISCSFDKTVKVFSASAAAGRPTTS